MFAIIAMNRVMPNRIILFDNRIKAMVKDCIQCLVLETFDLNKRFFSRQNQSSNWQPKQSYQQPRLSYQASSSQSYEQLKHSFQHAEHASSLQPFQRSQSLKIENKDKGVVTHRQAYSVAGSQAQPEPNNVVKGTILLSNSWVCVLFDTSATN